MSGPFKMKGWSGYQNSPIKQEEPEYKREKSMRTVSGVDKAKELYKKIKEVFKKGKLAGEAWREEKRKLHPKPSKRTIW